MTQNRDTFTQSLTRKAGSKPQINICKIGMVTRDYGLKFPNGYRDFSHSLYQVLKLLDEKGCDAALFSLFSIIKRRDFDPRTAFNSLVNIKMIFLEEFLDGESRKAGRFVIYYRDKSSWEEYNLYQIFGTMKGMRPCDINNFVRNEMPKRIFGNCCILLCGETNGVKYSVDDKNIHDTFGLRKAIPQHANIILNPIHDRMTRFEMKLKRKYLSENKRWVISVWNKGKRDKNGRIKDGNGPAWTVFNNGKEIDVQRIRINNEIDIGVLDIG